MSGKKILEGAKEAVEIARGNQPAAKITNFVGGPYDKGDIHCTLIQHRIADHWIAWNWDTGCWDKAMQPFEVLPAPPVEAKSEVVDGYTQYTGYRP